MQQLSTDDVTDVVLQASRALVAIAARSLASVTDEVTLPQYRALVVLCATGPGTMGALVEELTCSPSSATRLVDRLVAKGLVGRVQRESNRREVEVAVTAAGKRLVRDVTKRRRAELDGIVAAMPQVERHDLVRTLRAFAEAAGEGPDEAWATGWDL